MRGAPVVWSSGLFLLPQHFQQEQRHLRAAIGARLRATGPHGWGLSALVIDEALLAAGRVGLVRATGVMPDGTVFDCPGGDPLPQPLELGPDAVGETVVLAIPQTADGGDDVDFGNGTVNRWHRRRAADLAIADTTAADAEAELVQVGLADLRLMTARDAKRAGQGALVRLPVARIASCQADGGLVLDADHLPTVSDVQATPQLQRWAQRVHALLTRRAQGLAERLGVAATGLSDLADFLMLQTLNRHEPVFAQHAAAGAAGAPHPHQLHRDCLMLVGDLSTLASQGRRPPPFPVYRHDRLTESFTPVLTTLLDLLATTLPNAAVPIPLVARRHGVHTAVVADAELLRSASFVLAANAQMPSEQLRQRFPAKAKVGPVEQIGELVNYQLAGIGLQPLPAAPRQLPYLAGWSWFELNRGGDLWRSLLAQGHLAIHVPQDFPGIELQLWAIRG